MDKELGKLNLHNYKPLREIVFESLRGAIIEGTLKPGERLMEVQLAEKLGVSRTPVREAIRKLELEGLVIMIPRKGAYVADFSIHDLINVLEIRASLEGLAAGLAAERITAEELATLKLKFKEFEEGLHKDDIERMIDKDVELHDVIYRATRNQRLIDLIDSLREQVHRFRVKYINSYNKSTSLIEEHRKIVNAIEAGDSDEARNFAEEHIRIAQDFMIKQVDGKGKKM